MLTLQIIIASTRPGRAGGVVAQWFIERARAADIFDLEVLDLLPLNLPLLDEPRHPLLQEYEHEHTKSWSQAVARADAYVFVTPEYDYSAPASLVNAIQYLSREWAYKPAGFVSYGGVSGGTRSVQMLKQVLTAVKVMPIPEAVALPFFTRSIDPTSGLFKPEESQGEAVSLMLGELALWARALAGLRASR